MSDYPNMSYCMCENTLLAMEQILTAMQDDPDFFRDMSRTERSAFQELYNRARAFTYLSDKLADEFDTEISVGVATAEIAVLPLTDGFQLHVTVKLLPDPVANLFLHPGITTPEA
mgnify:CR=1 FL=1